MGARLIGCVVVAFVFILEGAWSEEVAAPESAQVASCPTVLPVEEGERSVIVPTVAPRFESPHPTSQLLPSDPDTARSLLKEKLAERDRLGREIAALRKATKTPEQVLVRVKMYELNLTRMRQMAIELSTVTDGTVEHVDVIKWLAANAGANRIGNENAMLGFLDSLERQKVGKVIAEPSVVTTSGQRASITVGGEIPVLPMPGESGGVKTQTYGTQLDVTAVSLGNNKVRLNVRPRISEIDTSRSVVVDGKQIRALSVRECNFSRELEFGKSAVMSGLVQERKVRRSSWSLRKSQAVEEVALVVVVTPEVVR